MTFLEADLSQHKYMLAMPCYDSKVNTLTVNSLLSSTMAMSKLGINYQVSMLNSGTLIDASRNELADAFLKSDCDTLVCLDSDMTWTWEELSKLLVTSHYYPVVAGAYTAKVDCPKFYVGLTDTPLNEHGLLKINHIGMGFVAIKKSVFEKLKRITHTYLHHANHQKYHAFFRLTIENGKYVGEDVYFFNRLKDIGIPAYLVPNIKLGHVGLKEYNTPFETALNKD